MNFTKDSLETLITEKNIKLERIPEKVDRRTQLTILCSSCQQNGKRTFEQIYKLGSICRSCVSKEKIKKIAHKLKASEHLGVHDLNEYIINKLQNVFIDKSYDYSKVNWNGRMSRSKVTVICKIHSIEWEAEIRNLLNGHGCRECGIEKSRKMFIKDFVGESKQKFGETRFDYSKISYKNAHQYVTLKCNLHNEEFTVIAREHLIATSGGCPSCHKINRSGTNHIHAVSLDDLKERIDQIWGDEYIYDFTDYSHLQSKIQITCKKHNYTWKSTATNHVNGTSPRGCRKCGLEASAHSKRMPQHVFVNRSLALHENKYDYSQVNYINNSTPVKIICKTHNIYEMVPAMHLNGYGCPSCSTGGVSKGQLEWLGFLQKQSKYDIIYKGGNHNKEESFRFEGKLYRTDGYCKETKTVYEFLGCWYHGCPECYSPEKTHSWKQVPMKELYQEFIKRKEVFEKNGFIMIYKWECKWNKEKCAYRIQVGSQAESETEEETPDSSGCLILDD